MTDGDWWHGGAECEHTGKPGPCSSKWRPNGLRHEYLSMWRHACSLLVVLGLLQQVSEVHEDCQFPLGSGSVSGIVYLC